MRQKLPIFLRQAVKRNKKIFMPKKRRVFSGYGFFLPSRITFRFTNKAALNADTYTNRRGKKSSMNKAVVKKGRFKIEI